MLNPHDKEDFLNQCEIETSLFNRKYAEQDIDWDLITNVYSKNKINKTQQEIPKVIHFIWLGGNLPSQYVSIIDDWKQKTGFDIVFWDDKRAEQFLSNKKSKNLFTKSTNFGIKSDVLRYEILNSVGGLYVDTDFICCSDDFKRLHESYSFYAGICLETEVQINNGIMASVPNHFILQGCIDNVSDTKFIKEIPCPETRVLYQTGPWLLTYMILYYLKNISTKDIIIFPSQTFHPFPARFRENQSIEFIKQFIKPCTMACHLWHASWQPKSKFFQGIINV